MSPYKRNLVTGLVVLIAIGVLLWMILTFSGRAMGIFKPKGTPVVFVSDRGDGLDDGSPVLYRGVQVGKVTAVHRTPDNIHVRIDGEIENQPPLPHNVAGNVKNQSQLGSSSQIELHVTGEPEGELAPHQEIAIKYTGLSIFPPEFSDFMEQVRRQELIRHVDETIVSLKLQVEKVGVVADSVQKLIGDPKLQTDLTEAMANVRQVTERANKIGANLETLTANANTTLAEVHSTVTDAHATITKANVNLDKLTLQVATDLDRLGVVFHHFEEVADKINKGKGTAGALINDPKLYDEMATTARELNVVATSLARLVDQWEHEGVTVKLGK